MAGVMLVELAATSGAVAATPARGRKVALLADALRRLAPDEIEAGATYLTGELRQRQTGVGWAGLRDLPPPAPAPSLSVGEVDRAAAAIARVAGPGSQARRRELLHQLFGAATADEQTLLRGLFSGELRQGAAGGVLVEAVAAAARVPVATVRRALLLGGDLAVVARAALTGGASALAGFSLRLGTPLAPMLAASAAGPAEALAVTGAPALVDTKLDGIRIQVHADGDQVAVFSRSLDVITPRLPAVVEAVRGLPARQVVLDGEAMALDRRGRPRPFQETASIAATRIPARSLPGSPQDSAGAAGPSPPAPSGGPAGGGALRVCGFFFDVLHVDGADLLDAPLSERLRALNEILPADRQVTRTTATTAEEVSAALTASVADGQEGVVVKSLGAPYDAGRRGSAWVKVKPRHTLDLVVLAAEWGHGRRRGWLSNLHLGARDPAAGDLDQPEQRHFVMLGKTFKGLTDELLRWQTRRFEELAIERNEWLVRVRPEQVVEVAFDGVQASTRYPGGVTLRFARVVRYRDDKTAAEADPIDAVRAIHAQRAATDPT
jgi:DNA ligase-1